MSNENSNLRASAPHPDFEYLRTSGREDGYTLEFTARVGEDRLFGVDLVRFNEAGKMTDLVVM
ncbi:hypothetical protein ACVWYH_004029 [Bradyrhizobium sp. GM24.11]